MIKVIESIQYHVWSDALHARELARRTENDWDRGAYVRWAIQTAWSAFENVCSDALQASGLGNQFKNRFKEALDNKNLPDVDWGQGIWQQVLQVYGMRKAYVHVVPSVSSQKLLAPVAEAELAINVLRDGIRAVLDLVNLPYPAWINDDQDHGWYGPRNAGGSRGSLTAIHAGAKEDDPEVIRIVYVINGDERVSDLAPPGTPYTPLLDRLEKSLQVPVDAVKAYRGSQLLEQRFPKLR